MIKIQWAKIQMNLKYNKSPEDGQMNDQLNLLQQ